MPSLEVAPLGEVGILRRLRTRTEPPIPGRPPRSHKHTLALRSAARRRRQIKNARSARPAGAIRPIAFRQVGDLPNRVKCACREGGRLIMVDSSDLLLPNPAASPAALIPREGSHAHTKHLHWCRVQTLNCGRNRWRSNLPSAAARFFAVSFSMLAVASLAVPCALAQQASEQETAPAPSHVEWHVHNYGDLDRTCTRWTDRCRSCSRDDGGAIACSNIGIACKPAEVECVRRLEGGEQK